MLTVVIGTLSAVGVAAATATAAGASGSQLVTYSDNFSQPGALPNAYPNVTGSGAHSDGWELAVSTTQVFAVTHHQANLQVTCWNQSNGSFCWPQAPTKIVTNGTDNYETAVGEGVYLDQATGLLYAWAVQSNGTEADNQAGVVCINTTEPVAATGSAMFCGFTPLTHAGDAPIVSGLYASFTAPVQVGTDWYSFNEAAGVGTAGGAGTENTLMCFNLTTFQACSTPNYTVPLDCPDGSPTCTVTGLFGTAPPIGASGSDIFVPLDVSNSGTVSSVMGCFDTATDLGCTGTWPVTLTAVAGSPFPLLNSSGTATGLCVPIMHDPCYSFAGASVETPTNLASTVGLTNTANGPATVIGASIYVPNFTTTSVDCFDYATSASCPHFPKVLNNLSELYTVNRDPQRPNCIWVNSDHGGAQIQNFDATTGGACAPGPIRLQAGTLVDPNPVCLPGAGQSSTYLSLQVTGPPRGSYSSGEVQFANPEGTIDSNIPAQPINAFGVADLSGLDFAGNLSPQFVITLNGLTSTPTTVSLKLIWEAKYNLVCISNGQAVSSVPGYWLTASDGGIFAFGDAGFYGSTGNLVLNKPIVGMGVTPDRGGYWLVASDGGIFAFGTAGFYGSTGNIVLNKPIVGMAATPDGRGYWLVASDGGIFSFGDAQFYGSAGNIVLNKPIVGMAATPDGGGYWLVASDGGVFSYGDAQFYGSTGNIVLNKPIVGMAANPNGGGYWMVASDGGIFSFGTSKFYGSAGNIVLNKPIVGMSANFNGTGYWLVASDGGIFNYGSTVFVGSAGNIVLNKPIVGIAT
ncbi:MAG: hypothetical protein ABSF84_05600 [Acidimicrobiales bacterium]